MKTGIIEIVEKALVGKTIKHLEFGCDADQADDRTQKIIGQKIVKVYTTYRWGFIGCIITLVDGSTFFLYDNEEIELED